jgi:hypothetical protein
VVNEFRFEIEITFRVPTFAVVAVRLVVRDDRLEIERTVSVPIFAKEATTFAVVTELLTAKLDRIPTEVMFGCAPWDTTKAVVAEATTPVTFAPVRAERADPFADTFDTEMYEGRSALTSARNEGAPAEPVEGPAKT